MRRSLFVIALAIASVSPATAQGVRCSAFLHERDGSWRSFEPGAILGPDGDLIEVQTGQTFRHGPPTPRDFVARLLDARCRPDR